MSWEERAKLFHQSLRFREKSNLKIYRDFSRNKVQSLFSWKWKEESYFTPDTHVKRIENETQREIAMIRISITLFTFAPFRCNPLTQPRLFFLFFLAHFNRVQLLNNVRLSLHFIRMEAILSSSLLHRIISSFVFHVARPFHPFQTEKRADPNIRICISLLV